jgi:hypothetical protein
LQTKGYTNIAAQLCGCATVPFRHGLATIDGQTFHPVFSRRGVVKVALGDYTSVGEDDIPQIQEHVCASLSLPETHFFDVTAAYLEPRNATSDEARLSEQGPDLTGESRSVREIPACFQMCSVCGDNSHGFILDGRRDQLGDFETKQEAFRALDRFVEEGRIRLEDKSIVHDQILDSKLRDREQPAVQSRRDPIFDDFDDFDDFPSRETLEGRQDEGNEPARFEACASCGLHGTIYDHNNEEVAQVLSKEEGLKTLARLVEEDLIYEEDRDAVRNQIQRSTLSQTTDQIKRKFQGGGMDAALFNLLQLATQLQPGRTR